MVDLNAHEAGNGGKSQGKPTAHSVLLYSEREGPPLTVACEVSICWPGLHPPAKSVFEREKNTVFRQRTRGRHFRHWPVYIHIPFPPPNALAKPTDRAFSVKLTPNSR